MELFIKNQLSKEERLKEAVDTLLGIIEILETNSVVRRKFTGLVALGNPKFDLYISTNDPSIDIKVSGDQRKWNYLMDCLPRYFDEKTSILDIAVKHELPYQELYVYLLKFKEKGLIDLVRK